MRHYLFVLILILASCNHEHNDSSELKWKYNNSSYPEQSLIGEFTLSTGSQDLYITKGEVFYPKWISTSKDPFIRNNINVCGKFPMELISMGNGSYNPNLIFEVTGKVIEYKDNVPLFYVTKWSSKEN